MGDFNPTLGRDSLPKIITPIEQEAREFLKDVEFVKVKGFIIDDASVDAGNTGKTHILRPGLALIRGAGTGGKFVPADHGSAPASNAILEAVILEKYVNMKDESGTAEDKEAAGRLAMSTHGVRAVINEIEIQPGVVTSIGGELADGWITMKVKSTLLYSVHVSGRDIEVGTQNGLVRLTGKLDSEAERALAIELAGNVRGVKGVDSSALTI